MKGTSKLIMGATLAMVICLAIVVGLILVLLAELYCSLLLRRRHLKKTTTNTAATTNTQTTIPIASPSHATPSSSSSPPQPFYAPGVLQAPRTFLFPKDSNKNHHQIIHIQTQQESTNSNTRLTSPRGIGLVSVPSPELSLSLSNFLARAPPQKDTPQTQTQPQIQKSVAETTEREQLVYISNPIYENEEGKKSGVNNTPFETPDTSPSRLERSDSSGNDDVVSGEKVTYTPPLTPMKKLPAEASSVSLSLRDATSLGTSCSDSRSVNNGRSSSSSGSPSTSSWECDAILSNYRMVPTGERKTYFFMYFCLLLKPSSNRRESESGY